ncbi:MAG TPA: hypothetical protein VFB16_06315 [Bauldia sp.]|nr:hypothetical protein [Bauldia sp.]
MPFRPTWGGRVPDRRGGAVADPKTNAGQIGRLPQMKDGTKMDFRKGFGRPKAPQKSRIEKKSEAEDALAAFLARGGMVTKAAPVVATTIACANCGYTGIVGIAEGKTGRCPRCREKLA